MVRREPHRDSQGITMSGEGEGENGGARSVTAGYRNATASLNTEFWRR